MMVRRSVHVLWQTAALGLVAFAFLSMAGRPYGAFATRGQPAGVPVAPVFTKGTLSVVIDNPTSVAFGPDGRLYVASETEITALTLDLTTHEVLDVEQIASGLNDVMGIAFDPTAAPEPVAVYTSRGEPSATAGFQGTVSTLTAPTWEREDVITGLPTSRPYLNHLTNGLAFDSDGRLFIAQGSTTDAGLADPAGRQEYWPETPLSAAILTADIHSPGFDGDIAYEPAGPPSGNEVNQVGGDVEVYAPGLRNPFDLVLHSNGLIYATDNGAMRNAVSLTCADGGDRSSTSDELNLIEEGNYYGAPNRNRGRFDTRQCTYHAPEEGSGPGFTGPIAVLPNHCSCDGIAEYSGDAFGGAMLGDLVYTEWSRGRVSRARLSEDGRSVLSISTVSTQLDEPLDLTIAPDGAIYVAQYGGDSIAYLSPDLGPLSTPTPTSTDTPAVTETPTSAASPSPTDLPATVTATPTPAVLTGDVDCNAEVNSIDAALVLQLAASLIGSLPCPEGGDASGDGSTNAIDAALILQLEAHIIGSLPP